MLLCPQIGLTFDLPGSIWSFYAEDESTREWAQTYAKKRFKVIITNWTQARPASQRFTVQHEDEDPFLIRFDHMWPYLPANRQQIILSKGGTAPLNVEEVLRKYGDGGRKVAGAGKMRGGGRAGFRPRRMVPGEGAGVTHLLLRMT